MQDNNIKAADKAVHGFDEPISGVIHKTRTPKNPISILRAVLKLSLQDRVDFRKEIDASIKAEVLARELQAKEAKDIANGLQ